MPSLSISAYLMMTAATPATGLGDVRVAAPPRGKWRGRRSYSAGLSAGGSQGPVVPDILGVSHRPQVASSHLHDLVTPASDPRMSPCGRRTGTRTPWRDAFFPRFRAKSKIKLAQCCVKECWGVSSAG